MRRPAWLSGEFAELQHKTAAHRRQKLGKVTKKKLGNVGWDCRGGVREGRA